MACSSADQSADDLLENNGAKLKGRNGILIWRWISGPPVTSRPDEEMGTGGLPQYLHLHLRQKNTFLNPEEAMWRPRRRW